MEKTKFDNLWHTLESRAGVHIEPDKESLSNIIKEVLPSWAAESFSHGFQELNKTLCELNKKFKKYDQGQITS